MPFKNLAWLGQDCRSSGTNEIGKRDFQPGNEDVDGADYSK